MKLELELFHLADTIILGIVVHLKALFDNQIPIQVSTVFSPKIVTSHYFQTNELILE